MAPLQLALVKTLAAPIVAVTVLEDRASVTRRGALSLEAGVVQIEIPAVAPVMVDKSVTVSLPGDDVPIAIVDTRPRRRWVTSLEGDGEADVDRVALRRELRERDEALEELDERRSRLRWRLSALAQLADSTVDDLSEDVRWGAFQAETAAAVGDVELEHARLAGEGVELDITYDLQLAARARLAKRLHRTASLEEFQRAWIEVDLRVDEACDAVVQIDYLVPCAVWRPYHIAELDRGAGRVTVSTDACVWQRTGEDWTDVALTLSTDRASLGVEPPELETDRLAVRKRRETVEVEVRTQSIDVLQGAGEEKEADGLPGIDDAGEAQHLRVEDAATIPSDGRPHRIRIGGFSTDAEVERICAAELASAVIVESRQTNVSDGPLLAGPVDLIMDGGYVGRSSVKYAGVGETFPLGWGPDGDIRVDREEERHHKDAKMLSSFETIDKKVVVRLSNLGSGVRRVALKERVPVSELPDKVKIDVSAESTSGGVAPDDDGIVCWDVELAPFGQAERTLSYVIKKHQDVRGL